LFKPYPIVIGSKSDVVQRRPEGPYPYGYRSLPPDLALRLMGSETVGPNDRARRDLMSVLKSEPVVPEEGRSYAQGPLLLTGPRSESLSGAQKEIDAKLASEMRRLLRLRYPAYG